jgi:hypothetical protein
LLKIKEDLEELLTRTNFVFKHSEILTECVKDYKGFSLLNMKIGPFKRGKNYKLKFFIAVPLIRKNILILSPQEKCDNIIVQRYAISERDDRRLREIDEKNFLNKIKEFKLFMEKMIEDRTKPKSDLDKFNSYKANIIDSRLLKLLRLARTELSVADERRLTNSERILISKISELIHKWRGFYIQ